AATSAAGNRCGRAIVTPIVTPMATRTAVSFILLILRSSPAIGGPMTLTQLFLEELDREADRTRRALEQVPLGKDDWKPHPKSMPLGRLAGLVASMPSWISLIIDQDELDLTPPAGSGQYRQPSTDQLVETHDTHVGNARVSLANATDDFLLNTKW